MNTTPLITITLTEYKDLKKAQLKLKLLEEAGVDNWEHYDGALYGWGVNTSLFDTQWEHLNNTIDKLHGLPSK